MVEVAQTKHTQRKIVGQCPHGEYPKTEMFKGN